MVFSALALEPLFPLFSPSPERCRRKDARGRLPGAGLYVMSMRRGPVDSGMWTDGPARLAGSKILKDVVAERRLDSRGPMQDAKVLDVERRR